MEDLNHHLIDYEFFPYLKIPFEEESFGNVPSLNCALTTMNTRNTTKAGFLVTAHDFNTLSKKAWLNDSIVKFYLYWLTKTNKDVYVLDPLFHHDSDKGVPVDKAVRNLRNKKINLFEHPVVFSTFVQGYHWRAVAIVNHRFHLLSLDPVQNKKMFFYFDGFSLQTR